jgi:deazaflavin-dependent oxidoreductase (nitroreductase family)
VGAPGRAAGGAPLSDTAEPLYLYLTTRGRRSGDFRQIEIWFTAWAGRWYLVAEHGERAHWVQNLLAEPRVRWRVADRSFRGRARVVRPEAELDLCRAVHTASTNKYGWGDGLVVELIADEEAQGDGET